MRWQTLRSVLVGVGLVLSLVACTKKPVPVPMGINVSCGALAGWGMPKFHPKQANTDFICHDAYALEYNPRSKTPMWVVEHLTRANLAEKTATRLNDFRPDPALEDLPHATLKDFEGSGYDRGHMAPAEDFRGSVRDMSESFFLSNMVPQNSNNNRDIWAYLEKNTRSWANQFGEVYVITGPVFYKGQSLGTIGPDRVQVPTHLFKVIMTPHPLQALAFIVPNAPEPANDLAQFVVPISTVEQVTGLQFFPNLDPAQQNQLKAQVAPWRLIPASQR